METTIMGLYRVQGLGFKLPEWVYIVINMVSPIS